MKHWITAACALLAAISLGGCQKEEPASDTTVVNTPPPAAPSTVVVDEKKPAPSTHTSTSTTVVHSADKTASAATATGVKTGESAGVKTSATSGSERSPKEAGSGSGTTKYPGWPSSAPIKTTSTGLKYQDLKVGTGPAPKAGDTVSVHYTGYLMDGTKFDSSVDRGQPFEFPLGNGKVIAAWDEGVASMKEGGKRKLIVPSSLGYGPSGTPDGKIPPDATLIFDVELLKASV